MVAECFAAGLLGLRAFGLLAGHAFAVLGYLGEKVERLGGEAKFTRGRDDGAALPHGSGVKIAKLAQAHVRLVVLRVAGDDMIEHVDFEELPGADEVARYLDVSL